MVVAAATALLVSGFTGMATTPAVGKPVHGLRDGQILYGIHDRSLDDVVAFRVNPDGSHAQQVYDQPMECAHWSPDGTQVASCGAVNGGATTIVSVDTGAARMLPSLDPTLTTPCYVWSSDSQRLACEGFSDTDPARNGIFTVRVSDWSDARRLTTNPGGSDVPGDYAPNSKQLVFLRSFPDADTKAALFRINVNGTHLRRLTPPDMAVGSSGAWSPQGNEILFSGRTDPMHRQSLWVIHADGTGLRQLPITGIPCGGPFSDPSSVGCFDPTWSPTARQIAFRINSAAHSVLERSDATGSNPHFVLDLGLDPGDVVDWGTHPLG